MRNQLLVGAGATLIGVAILLAVAIPAAADCGGPAWVTDVSRAQGRTFVATFLGVRQQHSYGRIDPWYHWSVTQTYAGASLPRHFAFDGVSCHPLKFVVGARYLVSYAIDPPQFPSAFDTVAYRLQGGGDVALVGFEVPASQYPPALHQHSLKATLNVLLEGLPPTDEAAPTVSQTQKVPLALLIVFPLAFALAWCWRIIQR